MTPAPAISVHGLTKRFGSTVALDDCSFETASGEVHALLGENGAGKSTLVKALAGIARPDAGEVRLFGEPVRLDSPRAAHRHGIQTAFQEISLVKDLTVTQCMLLPYEPAAPGGLIRRRHAEEAVRETLGHLGLGEIDPRAEVRTLALPTRQKIEIARAVSRKPRILLLDEPTASLTGRDVHWLEGLVGRQKEAGVTVVFISHRMQEVRAFCDRLTVLRNGRNVGSFALDEVDDDEVIRLVIGRSLAATFPPKPVAREEAAPTPALAAVSLSVGETLKRVSLSLVPGRILGVAALAGMGQRDLFLSLFGVLPPADGEIEVHGRRVTLRSPADAVRAGIGISLVPEERKTEALFLRLTGRENVSLPVIDRFERLGLIDLAAEARAVRRVLDRVQVDRRALYRPAAVFSGGNQQKIALAKWLFTGSRILLLYDPTRGVDVGTKAELYQLMRAYADAGGAVLFYSTDVPELVNLCEEVMVLYRGRDVARLSGNALSEDAVMRAALGGENPAEAARATGGSSA
jgi:ribose transport system ATP-binding protein